MYSFENYGVIRVIFSQMVSKNSDVDAPFQQKFKCHSSKMSCGHCNYQNAVFSVSIAFAQVHRETAFQCAGHELAVTDRSTDLARSYLTFE